MKNLTLLELNEINFDYVQWYIENGHSLPGFEWLIQQNPIATYAEEKYEELEPWIQWVSVHTGKTFEEHQVFRLGDIVNTDHRQIFEEVEAQGIRVGAISPMNAANKLTNPTYFIPDPWTKTETSGNWLVKRLSDAVSQTVNDNSGGRISAKSLLSIVLGYFLLVPFKQKISLMKLATKSKGKPWNKALFLDTFLYGVHKTLSRQTKTQFSTLFLNAGAHIQHHYFLNSPAVGETESNPEWYAPASEDPILKMLQSYDEIIQDITKSDDSELIVATGLSQKPYPSVKFYYRLRNHKTFLEQLGIEFEQVIPRMTRDFLIKFKSDEDAEVAVKALDSITVSDGKPLFGEIDNRGTELFVVLDYPDEVIDQTFTSASGLTIPVKEFVHFVAIKNGEHQTKGFTYSTFGTVSAQPAFVGTLHELITVFFKQKTCV
jgi:hypothetical protein